jgi:hypothetical protein
MNSEEVKQALKTHMKFSRIREEDIEFCDVIPLREGLKRGLSRVEMKACFNNSYRYATDYNGKYCLGFAQSIIPVEHAWVIEMNDFRPPDIWDLVRLEIISPSTVDPFEELAKLNSVT